MRAPRREITTGIVNMCAKRGRNEFIILKHGVSLQITIGVIVIIAGAPVILIIPGDPLTRRPTGTVTESPANMQRMIMHPNRIGTVLIQRPKSEKNLT
jgi:hypothetical protein